jgi:hypothetical protein
MLCSRLLEYARGGSGGVVGVMRGRLGGGGRPVRSTHTGAGASALR